MKDISKTELNNKIDFKSFIKTLKTLKTKKRIINLSKKQNDTLYNFTIDYATIREIQIENKISYTFKIIRDSSSNSSFENLVVISSNNKIQNAYLIKYTPTKEIEHIEKHNASSFEGNVNLNYNLKGTYCTEVSVPYCSWSYPHVAGVDCWRQQEEKQDGRIYFVLATICYDDGFIEPPIDAGFGGKSNTVGGPGDTGDAIPTTPMGVTNQDNKCEKPPKGDLNGDCLLQEFEDCMISGLNTSLFYKLGYSDQSLIQNFINENDCSDATKDFVNIAMEARDAGYEVNWDEGILNKLTDNCAKDIFTELENVIFEDHPLKPEVQVPVSNPLTLNFSESILKLFNDSDNTHLIIQNGDVGESNAKTIKYTITISENYLAKATELSIARTMIHESVHAYINGLYYSSDFQSLSFGQKLRKYAEDKGYIAMNNTLHHNFMGQYVDAMAYSLYEWDKDYGTDGSLDWNYYKSLAYGGMFQVDPSGKIVTEIDTFKELVPNASDRQAIADLMFNENKGNKDAKGIKCD
ncbi:MAG: hypothetical protein ABF311_09895 [Polaribacter sp.]|jgi:hypothetical protein